MTDDEQPAEPRAAGVNQAAIDWAWAQPIANNPGARMALLCLARRVNDMWECTASQEEVAVDAMVPARSMRRYLDQLEEGGFVGRVKRVDEKGHRLPCAFRLNPSSGPVANLASGSDQEKHATEAVIPAQVQRPDWPMDKADETESPSSGPVANLATGSAEPAEGEPSAKLATGFDQQEQPSAKLADGQAALWDEPENEENPSSGPVANLADGKSRTREGSSSLKKNHKKKPLSSEIREDVERLCSRLLSWLEKNDVRQRPEVVSDGWRTAARLLLDKDSVPLEEALAVLDWSQRDDFWLKNIHSMPTFRDKYGRLEIKSRGARGDAPQAATGTTGQRPDRLPPRVGGYENAKNFGKKGRS